MLKKKDLFIFDMDGVLYRTSEPIPSGIACVKKLRDLGKIVVFLTNNSSKTPENFAQKLYDMGLQVESELIYTSATITAMQLSSQYRNAQVYVIGEHGLYQALKDQGFTVLNEIYPNIEDLTIIPEDLTADLVVVGWDTHVNYNKFRVAMMLILKGAQFYATNDDASFPAPGTFWPGSGANVAFLSTALGKAPEKIFGKPFPDGIQTILQHYHKDPDSAVLVGDRLSTDILGGNHAKITTVFVETGINSHDDVSRVSEEQKPTYTFPLLSDMIDKYFS
ncbi:hypothetical protein NEF87_001298 [Candidatus Lokiarchaeum ossiferum]|uniref:HAD-IIA family hydrolase n=1 Tax=Candidatus Lokiarchaeum ossiferum TaxID=2951803 RepID=A0ABY6HNB9_9ARCH|nr:hypothetical protein NEF87_001298 [Candidatus Lokiarchaeum sp. B-35]